MDNEKMLELLLDKFNNLENKIDNLEKDMNNRFNKLDKELDQLKGETETIALKVNENNQILKQDNVKEWLELGSSAMNEFKKKNILND
ncbi:hypothetical protein MWH28_12220 [Natroniella sulfidigena]|uniref:hypothetical protein n=1 Tax=Natroniella sulfidigena TaxID=723921 RepID=UPI00200B5F3A|nr:hypothetical protein [Natroniella sulfidigena]MCK8818122.1 hypothetical protein [Natroniella sulfidigena]